MTDTQTEARAIQRYIAPSAGRGAAVQLLKHCDGEWVRYEDHDTALAAKDAELAEAKAQLQRQFDQTVRFQGYLVEAKAQLAEANKALEEIADAKTELTNRHDYSRGWNDALFRVRQIARRAREAQGGQNV